MRYMDKYGTAGQDAGGNIKGGRKMRFAFGITKGIIQTHTQSL